MPSFAGKLDTVNFTFRQLNLGGADHGDSRFHVNLVLGRELRERLESVRKNWEPRKPTLGFLSTS